MLVKRARGWTPIGSSLLFVGAFLCSLIGTSEVISSDVAEATGGKLKIEGGWSEVKEGWPMGAEDYFLATEKGHHFVESQDLPANLKYDLMVTFEYYYSYSKTKPVLQMTPCTDNIYIEDEASMDRSGQWLTDKRVVDREKCKKRNELAYNVLLHDPGDVFAWKVLKIESIVPRTNGPVEPTKGKPTDGTTEETTEATTANSVEITTEKPVDRTTERPSERTTKKPAAPTTQDDLVDLIDEESTLAPEVQDTTKTLPDMIAGLLSKKSTPRPATSKTTIEAPTTLRPSTQQTSEIPPKAMVPITQPRGTTQDTTRPPEPYIPDMIKDYLTTRRTSPAPTTKGPTPPGVTDGPSLPDVTDWPSLPDDTKEPSWTSPTSPPVGPTFLPKDGKEIRESAQAPAPAENLAPAEENIEVATTLRPPPETAVRPVESEKTGKEKPQTLDDDPIDATLNQRRRRKRAILSELDSDQEGELVNAVCAPSSCNKHLFKMARFSALINGLPKRRRKAQASKYFVNLKNKPLKMKVESHEESLAEVDTCVSFLLYMEANTELELLLENGGEPGAADGQRDRLLESIKRRSYDSTAGRWDEFHRCISDYMPEYKPNKSVNNGKVDQDNSLGLILRPKGEQRPGQVAVLIPQQHASYLSHLYRKQSFLPDIKRIGDTDDFKKYWIVDRDGLAKAQLSQTTALASGTQTSGDTTSKANDEKVLQITNIDSTQESFDLTSRWLQIKDAETLELPVQFVYKAEQADWIDRVDFQFQRSSAASDEWISQTAFRAPAAKTGRLLSATTEAPKKATGDQKQQQQQATATNGEPTPSVSDANDTRPKTIELPIELKGLDSSEFRLRLRHYVKRDMGDGGQNTGHTALSQPSRIFTGRGLNIKSLAFADACSYGRPFCKNNGQCKPTGPAQAECVCPQGFSGRFCEHVRPCEVLYTAADGKQLTGQQLCRSVGARCIDQLPVMRCEWPNDRYYQCKKLFRLDASGQGYTLINQTPNSGAGPSSGGEIGGPSSDEQVGGGGQSVELDDEAQLRAKLDKAQGVVGQQAQLIIILAVFIVALLVFAVVLLGSMVGRLRKSSRRLKKSQGEVHELSRRAVHPGGFGGSLSRPVASTSGPPRPGAGGFNLTKSSSPTVGYNNSAFDVES